MKKRIALLLTALGAMVLPSLDRAADEPVSLIEEPFATFDNKLKAFAAQPSEAGLRDLNVLCMRLPVRDKLPNQIGAGHPLDRQEKLTYMLRFITVLDRVREDVAASIAASPKPILDSDNSPENSLVILRSNFRVHLERTRERWAVREIPDFFCNVCRNCDPAQMRALIRCELKQDPDAPALIDEFSQKIDAR